MIMVSSIYSVHDAAQAIWVYVEQEQGALENVSLEMLSKGRMLADQVGWPLAGILVGSQVSNLGEVIIAHGADEVWFVDHPLLEHFTIEAYTYTFEQVLKGAKPSILLLGATPNGRDLAGRLAVRLRTGLNADCTGLSINPDYGVLVSEVSGFGGGILALIEMQYHRPQMATVRPGVFPLSQPDHTRTGSVIPVEVDIPKDLIQTRIVERQIGEGVDLTRALALIAGGRGMDGNFQILRELADLLKGEVGATRPPVDEGHIQRERQIGQTGVVCSPKVAICCGISGAFHFVVGIEKADIVIAINTDPQAEIFEYADYCIVGDVHQIIPELLASLKQTGVSHA
jgi:electron transfer flavoprotein alpha subunit